MSFEIDRLRTQVACVLLAMFWAAARASGAIVFAPPDDSVDAANELRGIERELADRNYPAAAKRLDLLLAARARPLASLSEGTLTSIAGWVEKIARERRKALAAACEASAGAAARQALESLRNGRAVRPEEFHALARRYPLTDAAGAALAQAGDLALRGGDFPAAQVYYELALRADLALGELRQRRLESLQRINAVAPSPAPADLERPDAVGGAKPQAADQLAFSGPLPFDATWYGNSSAVGRSKFFPAAYGDRILLASWKNVTMLREDGTLLWDASNPKPPGWFVADRAMGGSYGALFAPATLCDVHGRPVIIVVRQPGDGSDGQYLLRALRASDGKILWSTESASAGKEISYAGLPAVSGRYVYSVAVARTGVSSANLLLCALDISTGQTLWQETLGSVTEQGERAGDRGGRKFGRGAPLALEPFAELSEPAVAGDLVVVAPNCGSVIAVDRFDGKIRWVGAYRAAAGANVAQPAGERGDRWTRAGERERSLQMRYKSTPVICGDVVVTLPQDAAALFAFDRISGKRLWESEAAVGDALGLAGASGNMAITCGAGLAGIDAGGTGKLKWKFTPKRGIHLTGPAVVLGGTVLAPTSAGIVQLDAADGSEKAIHTVPDFRRLMTTDGGRSAVIGAGAAHAFGMPPDVR